jgi:hypothetical protein
MAKNKWLDQLRKHEGVSQWLRINGLNSLENTMLP